MAAFLKIHFLSERFKKLARSKKRLHLAGLLSDAGVHSNIDHLLALIKMALMQGITSIIVHPFLDGRDVPPESASRYIEGARKCTLNP